MEHITKNYVKEQIRNLKDIYEQIIFGAKNQISKAKLELGYANKIMQNAHPVEILKRGFAIVHQEGKVVTKKSKVKENKAIELEFSDGKKIIKNN